MRAALSEIGRFWREHVGFLQINPELKERGRGLLMGGSDATLQGSPLELILDVSAVMASKELDAERVALYEFGAAYDQADPEGAIAHYFAQRQGTINYHAFDPNATPDAPSLATYAQGHNVSPLSFRASIVRLALPSYEEARRAIGTESRAPIIFSNNTLDDPNLQREYPFWQLPGIHVHSVNLDIFANNWGLTDVFVEPTLSPQLLGPTPCQPDPEFTVEALKKSGVRSALGLTTTPNYREDQDRVTYFWDSRR